MFLFAACGARGDEAPLTDGEVWNEGVGYYDGDPYRGFSDEFNLCFL